MDRSEQEALHRQAFARRYEEILAMDAASEPSLLAYRGLDERELKTLIRGSASWVGFRAGVETFNAAYRLGWLTEGADGYGVPERFLERLTAEGRLVHFYVMLKSLITEP